MRPLLSYCTTCRGRLHHLKQTLPLSVMHAVMGVEFLVLDYGSEDGLGDWMRKEMGDYIKDGRVTYCRIDHPGPFCMAHAKNLAHCQASGQFLCNLDSDYYAWPALTSFVLDHYRRDPDVMIRPLTGGFIGLSQENFRRLGGYDERMVYGWGAEDNDLWDRSGLILPHREIVPYSLMAVQDHSEGERAAHSNLKDIWESNRLHGELSRENLKAGRFQVNMGQAWGTWPKIVRNFKDEVVMDGNAVS